MSFFLLGKGPDEDLFLLSTVPAASRKDALAHLARITASSDFEHWDAEVFVLDLEQGTPVLLVRPSEMTPSSDTMSEPAEEPADQVVIAPQAPDESEDAQEPEPPAESAPEMGPDEALDAMLEELTADAEVEESVVAEEPEPIAVMPVEAAIAEGVIADLGDEHEESEANGGESDRAVAEDQDSEEAHGPEEASALREALQRTAAHMEASGVVAPESVSSALVEVEVAVIEATVADKEPSPMEAEFSEPEGAESGHVPAWPWAEVTAGAPEVFALSALEAPGVDEGSLVRAAGDEETMSFARPVILGSYADSEALVPDVEEVSSVAVEEPDAPVEPAASAEQPAGFPDAAESEGDDEQRDGETEAPVSSQGDGVTSDFILDLDPPPVEIEAPSGYQPKDAVVEDMTCDDCVYVETCPNKDQREPASCGSFQWK